MERTTWIRDLELGQDVELPVHIITSRLQDLSGGRTRLDLTVGDRTGSLPAVYWDVRPLEWSRVRQIRFADVSARVQQYRGKPQLNLSALPKDLGTPADLADYLICSPIPLETLNARLTRHIESVKTAPLHALLIHVFVRDKGLSARFKQFPAAQSRHHAFHHGLLHHTLEVTDLVAAMAGAQSTWGLRSANRDLAVTGALLHDIGKTDELDGADNHYTYSVGGQLLGHITQGVLIVARAIARVRKASGFPPELEQLVLHLISSHHGKGEWGSPEPPKTMEACMLHAADKASAELYYFHEAIAQASDGEEFVNQSKLEDGATRAGRSVFVGDMRDILDLPVSPPALPSGAESSAPASRPDAPAAELPAGSVAFAKEAKQDYRAPVRQAALPILRLVSMDVEHRATEWMRSLPLVGRVAAGTRLLDPENLEGNMLVEAAKLSASQHYLLRVQGDSMSRDGIKDRDVLVVRSQDAADPHEIAVCQVADGGPVVKRLEQSASGIRLLSSNPTFAPVQVPHPELLRVQGIVVAIAR